MASNLVPQSGTDINGNPYTRMVKPPKASAVRSVPKSAAKPPRRNKHTNEHYADEYLGIETLVVRWSDSLDFHDVGTGAATAMLNEVAKDSLGRELTPEEMASIVNEHLWDAAEDYDSTQVQHSDRLDFHDVFVGSINSAINNVRLLAN